MVLTRQQRERLVLDLYNQGKNTREISQEVGISFRDIGSILSKARLEKEAQEQQGQKISQAAQAYKLFSEDKSPVDVAIALNLRQAEVTEFYREYWNLKQLYELHQVYEEIKDDIYSFVKLYKLAKAVGMNTQHVGKLLGIANSYLPAVEYRYQELKIEEAFLQAGNRNSARTLQELSDRISITRNTLEQYESDCKKRGLEIKNLNKEYTALQELVNDFQNNSEDYIKITGAVEDKVLGVLSNAKVLLRYALLSITESIRNDPERYRLIFYNMSPSITNYSSSNSQPQQLQYLSPDNNTEANAAMIVDEAEKLYNKVVKDNINKIIIDYPFSKSSLPSLPLLPASDEVKSYEIKSNSS
jgi:hypothetical protein